jgi:hypothetical protein
MKMKQLSRILIIVLFLVTSLGVVPGLASPDIPPTPIYLPFVSVMGGGSISISGTVLDIDAYPVANRTQTEPKRGSERAEFSRRGCLR